MMKKKFYLPFIAVCAALTAFSPSFAGEFDLTDAQSAADDDLFSDDSFFTDDTLAGNAGAAQNGSGTQTVSPGSAGSASSAGSAAAESGTPISGGSGGSAGDNQANPAGKADSAGKTVSSANNAGSAGSSAAPAVSPAPVVSSTPVSIDLFQTGSIRFGGRLDGRFDTNFTFSEIEKSTLKPVLSGNVYFDARPQNALRIYGKLSFDYPFTFLKPTGVEISQIKIAELFTDFSSGDTVHFRFGKHQAVWGTGYFFSPADIINITAIDPEDPAKDREGPLSLRILVTAPAKTSSLWLYIIPDVSTGEARKTAAAAKYEFLAGDIEIGAGLWYAYPRPPRAVATITGALASTFSVFAEGTAAWGSEEQWEDWANPTDTSEEVTAAETVQPADMGMFFQATAGFTLTMFEKLTVIAQYYFNGFGSDDVSSLTYEKYTEKVFRYGYAGRHYAAALVTLSDFPARHMSVSAFTLMSIVDFSGTAQLTVSCPFMTRAKPRLTLSAGPAVTFGRESSEFLTGWDTTETTPVSANSNPSVSLKVSVTLGGGKF